MTVVALLLAAGEASRMGQPKPLLEWGGGKTLIEYQLTQLTQPPIDSVVVVLGHAAEQVKPHLRGAKFVVNERYAEGRASSLRAGAASIPDEVSAIVIANVDQPRSHDVIARLVDIHQLSGSLITAPTFEGKRGHPPVLDGSLLPELRQVDDQTLGLRAVIEKHAGDVNELAFETDAVLLDINEPEEYARARAANSQPQGQAHVR